MRIFLLTHSRLFYLFSLIFFLTSCAPNVRLSTPDPVKIDVNMKVEIVQKPSTSTPDTASPVAITRRNRMAQIQTLKDNRLIGENQNGYLTVLTISPAWKEQETYIRSLVESENNDRQYLNSTESRRSNKPLTTLEKESAQRFQASAFSGEWIQTDTGKWIQKK